MSDVTGVSGQIQGQISEQISRNAGLRPAEIERKGIAAQPREVQEAASPVVEQEMEPGPVQAAQTYNPIGRVSGAPPLPLGQFLDVRG